MEREVVTGPGLQPQIGPYSQAVRAGGILYVSGQTGVDPGTGAAAGPSFSAQARQAFANLDVVLRAHGAGRSLHAGGSGERPVQGDRRSLRREALRTM